MWISRWRLWSIMERVVGRKGKRKEFYAIDLAHVRTLVPSNHKGGFSSGPYGISFVFQYLRSTIP